MTGAHWRTAALGLALALVASLVALGIVMRTGEDDSPGAGTSDTSAEALLKAETEAEQAARAAAVHLTTYDYRTLDTDFDWVVTAGTQAFRERFAEVSVPTKRYVRVYQVHAEGSVDEAAATAQDPNHVTVLLFVDQTLTSDAGADRELATPRVRMSMVRTGGVWLVDDVAVRNLVPQ